MSETLTWEPGDPRDRSITGFRIRNGRTRGPMSTWKFYDLQRKGLGPRLTHLGPTSIIITPQDELAWQEARANPKGTELKLISLEAKRRSIRMRKASVEALKSPLHPANVKRAAAARKRTG